MPQTPTMLLPYPAATDPADVPTDLHELADRLETVRGLANGLASLDATGKVPAAQLPAAGSGGDQLAFVFVATDVAVAATVEASATTIATAPAFTSDGSAVVIDFQAPTVSLAANGQVIFTLWEGSSQMGWIAACLNPAASVMLMPVRASVGATPAAGSRTYSVRAFGNVASANVVRAGPGGAAGLYLPINLRVTKA